MTAVPDSPLPLTWYDVIPAGPAGDPLCPFALSAHTTQGAALESARRLASLLRRLDTLNQTAFESAAKAAAAKAGILADLTPYLRADFRPDSATSMPASLDVYRISCARPSGLLRAELVIKERIRQNG